MMERDTFVFHLQYLQHIRKLQPAQRLYVYEFMAAFAASNGELDIPEPPEIDLAVNMILGIITDRMRSDFRKYDETRAKRAEGGKLGGRPKKPQGLEENLKVIEEPKGYSENLKNPVYVSDTDTVSVSDNECVSDTEQRTHPITDRISEVKEFCRTYCSQKGYPVPEEEKMIHYAKYASGDKWKTRIAGFVEHDEFIRKSTPIKSPHQNFASSDTDYDAAALQIMEMQQEQMG